MKEPVRILLADPHAEVRAALRRLLEVDPGLAVCAEVEQPSQTGQALKKHHPDLLIMDPALPRREGMEHTRHVRAQHPHLPILILSLHKETTFAESALQAGALGYLMKNDAPEQLVHAVREVMAGRIYVSEAIRQGFFARLRSDPAARRGVERRAGIATTTPAGSTGPQAAPPRRARTFPGFRDQYSVTC